MKNAWKTHKGKIIAVIAVIAILTAAFFWGGNYSKNPKDATVAADVSTESSPSSKAPLSSVNAAEPSTNTELSPSPEASSAAAQPVNSVKPSVSVSQKSSAVATTGNNITSPSPVGKAAETQETCTLSVDCSTILNNMNLLDKNKWDLVPKDGSIFASKTVSFNDGESVFNVLQREMKKAGIQMEFKDTPMYNSAYIEGIDNLYEFDVGDLSGWVYEVNGKFPNFGCSRYTLKNGDVIKWHYTCDLGKDVGGNNSTGS